MKFSVIMNVYNEEEKLEYALKSLKSFKNCDEILIADMNSNDNTINIAEKYGAKILEIPYCKNFDSARSVIIENAKNEWCLLFDADEMISKTMAEKIDSIVEENKYDVVYFPTINYFFGEKAKYGLHYPCHHCRLFRKQNIIVTGIVHHYLEVKKDSKELWLQGEEYALLHFSFDNIDQWMKKRARYIDLETNDKKFKSPLLCFIGNFNRFYFKEKNYKGGYNGFILSILCAISEEIANIKKYYDSKNINIDEIKNKYLERIKI